jgi:hypothetical protein
MRAAGNAGGWKKFFSHRYAQMKRRFSKAKIFIFQLT